MTMRQFSIAAALAASLMSCKQQPLPAESAAGATPQTSAREAPAASDTASNTGGNAAAYTPPPPPPVRTIRVTVPEGTQVHMTLSNEVGSATSQIGDRVTGTTTEPIVIGDRVAIPAGSTVHGQVTGVDPAKKGLKVSEKGGAVALSFTKVTTPGGATASMSGSLTSVASSKGKTAGIIGGSAAGGAILGKIIGGHTKDAAIGAVIGGGIGTGIAAGTKGKEVVIPAGTDLAITLDRPLTISQRS